MKKTLLLAVILVFGIAWTSSAFFQAPHNASNSIDCVDCHVGGFPTDTPPVAPVECVVCHNSPEGPYTKTFAPQVRTHSSTEIGSTKYDTWATVCKDCHKQAHDQWQTSYGASIYLVTGRVTSAPVSNLDGTTTVPYTILTNPRTAWGNPATWGQKSSNHRGLIFFNTTNTKMVSEVVSATASEIILTGTVTADILVNQNFALIYGQYVGNLVRTPSGVNKTVKLFDKSGTNSFAYSEAGPPRDLVVDGVCQVCHTKTSHWRSDGTLAAIGVHANQNGTNCMTCHPHAEGFKAKGCDTCHGYPPIENTPTGGPNGLVNSPAPTGSQTAGAHGFHVNTKTYDCTVCHFNSKGSGPTHNDGTVQAVTIGFSFFNDLVQGGSYDGQSGVDYNTTTTTPVTTVSSNGSKTCSNIYCHSSVQGPGGTGAPTYASPAWDNPTTAQCGSCHNGDGSQGNASLMDTGSHPEHLSASPLKDCNECHSGFGSGSVQHVNNAINIAFKSDPSGNTPSYSQSPNTPGEGYGSCSTVYCHSSGKGTYTVPPAWGSTTDLVCNGCHGTGNALGKPDYANAGEGTPNANSHDKHALSSADCGTCHTGTTTTGTAIAAGSALHTNRAIDVTFDAAKVGASATWAAGTKTCSNISCHSTGTPVWGGTLPADCSGCHGGNATSTTPIALPNHPEHMNNSSVIGTNFECAQCHNQTVSAGNDRLITGTVHANGTKNVSFQFGGSFTNNQCSSTYCHSSGKGTFVNPPAWGSTTDLGCNACHGTGNALGAPDYASSGAGLPNANSHSQHVAVAADCAICHTGTTAAGTSIRLGSELHINQTINVTFDTARTGAGATFNAATKTCSSVSCHGTGAPQWGGNIACGSCHAANNTIAGGHGIHYATATQAADRSAVNNSTPQSYVFNCGVCHNAVPHANGSVQVSFDAAIAGGGTYTAGTPQGTDPATGFTWTNGTCSSTYCHSNGAGGPANNTAFNWATTAGTLGCTGCHNSDVASGTVMANGSHGKHVNNAAVIGSNFACSDCHQATVSGNRTIQNRSKHVNKTKDVVFSFGGTFANNQCSSTYCHSSGKGTFVNPPAWGSTTDLGCNACHGTGNALGRPDYTNGGAGTANANSHAKHATVAADCAICHTNTTATGTAIRAGSTLHTNNAINVTFDTAQTGAGATYNSSNKTCSTVSCHGAGTPQWGGTVTCQSCHLGTADLDNFSGTFWDNGTAGVIGSGEWTSTGHGRATGNYTSGNAPAGFTTTNACLFCHDDTITHNNASNPFRLRNIGDALWGKNGNCQLCHATGSAGVTVDGVLKNSANKVGSTHYGTKHNVTANGGQFCWDCHDPHGDNNIFMVHATVAKTSDAATGAPLTTATASFTAFATGTDYAGGTNSTRICNTCHTSVSHYTSTTSDTHNASIRCTNCHKHSGETRTDAFKPSGENCFDCHSSAGGPTPGTSPDAYHARHIQTAFVGRVSDGDYGNYATNQWYRQSSIGGAPDLGCGQCHPQSSATHMNGVVNLNFSPTDAGATGKLKAKNAATPVFTQNSRVSVTCSSVYCHSNGYDSGAGYGYQTSDNWYTAAVTGDVCAKCHGNSPNSTKPGSPAHGKHVVGIHYKTIFTGTTGLATPGATTTSSHGNATTSTTMNCNICHNATVSTSGNDANTVCATCHTGSTRIMTISATSTSHVNGVVDVVFAGATFRSKAQIRDDITTVPELDNNWTRTNGYKVAGSNDVTVSALNSTTYSGGNCTVSCHNGNTVRWNSTVTCISCHTDLP